MSTGTQAFLTDIFRVPPQSLQQISETVPRIGHDSFLSTLFQFMTHLTIGRDKVQVLRASLNNSLEKKEKGRTWAEKLRRRKDW
jgi:hypothetical protein